MMWVHRYLFVNAAQVKEVFQKDTNLCRLGDDVDRGAQNRLSVGRDVMDATCIMGTYAHVWMCRPRTHTFQAAGHAAFKLFKVDSLGRSCLQLGWVWVYKRHWRCCFGLDPASYRSSLTNASQLPINFLACYAFPAPPSPMHLADLSHSERILKFQGCANVSTYDFKVRGNFRPRKQAFYQKATAGNSCSLVFRTSDFDASTSTAASRQIGGSFLGNIAR